MTLKPKFRGRPRSSPKPLPSMLNLIPSPRRLIKSQSVPFTLTCPCRRLIAVTPTSNRFMNGSARVESSRSRWLPRVTLIILSSLMIFMVIFKGTPARRLRFRCRRVARSASLTPRFVTVVKSPRRRRLLFFLLECPRLQNKRSR